MHPILTTILQRLALGLATMLVVSVISSSSSNFCRVTSRKRSSARQQRKKPSLLSDANLVWMSQP